MRKGPYTHLHKGPKLVFYLGAHSTYYNDICFIRLQNLAKISEIHHKGMRVEDPWVSVDDTSAQNVE